MFLGAAVTEISVFIKELGDTKIMIPTTTCQFAQLWGTIEIKKYNVIDSPKAIWCGDHVEAI